MSQKRVAAIHDISCFGKCSLTVALPILSAAGIETPVIPTAVLSTHTGGFSGYTFRDLTDDIMPVAKHWKKEGITVDAVYSGYLGSKEQIGLVMDAVREIKNDDTIMIVDPVMADNGKLYGGFAPDFPTEMRKLCETADIITPNITEATFMLGVPYRDGPYDEEYINDIISGLAKMTSGKVVLTGVFFDDERIGAACFDGKETSYAFSERIPTSYHGTGDVFSSTLVSAIMNGKSLKQATQIAVDFTYSCIKRTFYNHPEMKYGVNFEAELPYLLKML
ncbi:MAG: pyridoxamine kinase [Clostridia bacterium]|nr:pyridoxamine kinase [Clostridia bacterium]